MTSRLHPFVRLLLCAISLIAVTVALTLILAAGNYMSTAFTDLPPKETFAQMVERYQLALTLLTYPAYFLVINAFRTKLDRASFVSLGLRPIKTVPNLLSGALAGTLAIGVLWSILWLTGAIDVQGWSAAFFENPIGAILPLGGYFFAFCAVAFFEETLFRGYILHNLTAWVGWRWAVVGQAFLFAIVHLGNVIQADKAGKISALWSLPALLLIAVFFALSYRKTGSLWFPIGFHCLWNFSLGCLFSLPVSGIDTFRILDVTQNTNSLLSGGSFGAEGSLYLPVLLLAMIYFIRQTPDHPQAALDLALLRRKEIVPEPTTAPASIIGIAPEEEEERTEPNRYKARFGSQEGFDSQTLRELRELQRGREEAKAAELAFAKAQAEAEARAIKPIVDILEPKVAEPVVAVAETVAVAEPIIEVKEAKVVPVEKVETVVPTPIVEKAPEIKTPEVVKPVATPEPEVPKPTVAPPPPVKKPSPKW